MELLICILHQKFKNLAMHSVSPTATADPRKYILYHLKHTQFLLRSTMFKPLADSFDGLVRTMLLHEDGLCQLLEDVPINLFIVW